jgi:hypothetical protein
MTAANALARADTAATRSATAAGSAIGISG